MTHTTPPYTIITGASSGIGLATANILARNGKNLILLARREERLKQIKTQLEEKHNVTVEIFVVDVCKRENVDHFFEKIREKNIEALINNAGLARGRSSFHESSWQPLEEMIETNIKAFTYIAHASIPLLIKSQQGHMVNISSIAGRDPYAGGHVYCGTKAFVTAFSKALRHDLLGKNVRVTDIAPGAVETEFSQVRFSGDTTASKEVYKGFSPLTPEDIAESILYVLTAPRHVNVAEIVLYPTAQAGPTAIHRTL